MKERGKNRYELKVLLFLLCLIDESDMGAGGRSCAIV